MISKKVFFLIGVDPGASTGVCLYNRSKKTFSLHTVAPWDFMELVDGWLMDYSPDHFHIYMEDPRQIGGIYNRHTKVSVKKQLHIAQGVGSVKRDTDWLEVLIESMGIEYTLIKPADQKWTPKTMKAITGYSGRSNEHTRDALRLVYGR